MHNFKQFKRLNKALAFLILITGFLGSLAQADMISTNEMITVSGESYSQMELQTALASEELKEQLQTMGVDVEELNDRIASLTPGEIQQLNAELEQQPAGA